MNKSDLKIVFFGTPEFAVPVLKALIDNEYTISAVFTGKGPIEQVAKERNVKIFQPSSLKKDEPVFEEFKNLKPDICIIVAYGKIIPQKFLDIPPHRFLNIHPSLLPKYRGPSPIQTAILNGDKETGVAIMAVDAEVDHGPILASEKFKIKSEKYFPEIVQELAELGAKLLIETLPRYLSGKIKPKEQDHSRATFTKMFQRKDGRINWDQPCEIIFNQVRALNPEPGTWTTWKGKVINIPTCDVGNPQVESLAPGTVRKIDNDIAIRTGTGYLILKSVQLEGGKVMDAKSFVNGHPDFLGSRLE